jgi:hypothetical protein
LKACKSDPFDVSETVDMLNHRQMDQLWKGLNDMCMNTLLSFGEEEEPDVMDEVSFIQSINRWRPRAG